MKIALVTTSFKPYEWRSGISNAVFLLARDLKRRGFEVKVFSPLRKGQKQKETKNNVTVERFGYRNEYFTFSPGAIKMIKEYSPNLVHSFHYGFHPATAGLEAAKQLGVPHILTPAYHPPIYSRLKKALFGGYDMIYGKSLVKNSDMLIVFNNNEKRQMLKYGPKKIDIVPAPVNNDVFYPHRHRHPLTVAYVGSFLPWKGAGIAMDIFKQIEKKGAIKFFFIGGGPMYKELKKAGGQNFRFFLEKPSPTVARLYSMCDVVVSPTYYESFGCVLAEAAMCGVPAVATRVGAVPETVGKGGLLVNYGDWNGMKTALEKLLYDSKLREKLSHNAIKHARNFEYKRVISRICKSYEDVL